MSALRHGLRSTSLVLALMAGSAATAGPSTSGGTGPSLPPGPPGPPGLHGQAGGDRPFFPPQRGDRPRERGGRGSVAGLIAMMDGISMDEWAMIDEPVTSTGNENFWLSNMERSALTVVKPTAPASEERLARR